MTKKFKELSQKILQVSGLWGIAMLLMASELRKKGWFQSSRSGHAVDKSGQYIPWCTYPFIDFIEKRLKKEMTLFEFSCGSSTVWYAGKVAEVTAVEHDKIWFEKIRQAVPKNVILSFGEDGDSYLEAIKKTGKKFDLVSVDGIRRVDCMLACVENLSEGGVIIVDNSERPEYQPGYDFLVQKGFKRINFWGMGPINAYGWCTSIFYRELNCLGI